MAQSTLDPDSRLRKPGKSEDPLEQIPTASQEGIDHLRSKHTQPTVLKPSGQQAYEDDAHPAVTKRNAQTESENKLSKGKSDGSEELEQQEDGKKESSSNSSADEEENLIPYTPKDKQDVDFNGVKKKRRRAALFGGGGVIALAIGAFGLFGSGPAQLIHFAEILERFHLTANQDLGNDRGARGMLYTMLGSANRSRLGVVGNKFADRWEKRLIRDTGMRPVFSQGYPNRFIGFEIENETKARRFLQQFDAEGIETRAGPGGKVDKKGNPLTGNKRIVTFRGTNAKERRVVLRAFSKGTDTNAVASRLNSRLLIKRAGVDFHPLKNVVRDKAEKFQDWRRERREERAKSITDGVDGTSGRNVRKLSDENKDKLQKATVRGAGALVVVTALCAVQDFGDDVVDYKEQVIVQRMVRIGGSIITVASQVKSSVDVNSEELGIVMEDLHDSKTGQSYTNAKSIQAELGNPQTGPDIDPGAKPGKVGEKPLVFAAVDGVETVSAGLFGLACAAIDRANGLAGNVPGVKQAASAAAAATEFAINLGLRPFGLSQDKLMQSAFSLLGGDGVNPLPVGPALGNVGNYGLRLFARDQIVANGGRELTNTEVVQLKQDEQEYLRLDWQDKSLAQRYLDPYEYQSITGQLIDNTPRSPKQFASMMMDMPGKLFSSMASLTGFGGKAYAQAGAYDYGFPEFGFSVAEKNDPRFENPDENAVIVEQTYGVENLNNDYGECFSMKIDPETLALQNGESVNVDTLPDKCKNGEDERLLRFRFYLLDTVTMRSLMCYEGDEESCSQLGFGNAQGATEIADPSAPLTTLSGQPLSANHTKWLKFIKDEALPLMPGNIDVKALAAARGAWWALKEGVLDRENPHTHSLCHTGGDHQIPVTDVCPDSIWQVGIAGIQPKNFSIGDVRSVLNGRSEADVLKNVAKLVGVAEGSAEYNSIINSTGILRLSLLVRDPAIGLTLVAGNVKSECLDRSENWCKITYTPGKDFTSSRQLIDQTIGELEQYFKGTTAGGVNPPNLGAALANNYYRMPNPTNGAYTFNGGTPSGSRCGSKELVNVIHTVANQWYQKYPSSKIVVGDLNAPAGHASHKNGVDVDIYTADKSAADTSGSAQKSKELGRLFADTGKIDLIFYNDASVQSDFNSYVSSKNLSGAMQSWPNHENHFHVRIADQYKLPTSLGCPS